MARPKKCRICGYRFRGNEDICPECFTAREDDITCRQFSEDEHTHSSGMSVSGNSDIYQEFKEKSFIDEQRSEEANDPIPSATYGGKQGTPPPTYAQQSYNNRAANANRNVRPTYGNPYMQSRQDKLNALRNGTNAPGHNTFYTGGGIPNNNNNAYYTRQGQKKANGAVVAVIVIIFLSIFFIPFIMGLVSSINGSSSRKKTTTTARKNIEVTVSMPDFSFPDISIPDYSDYDVNCVTAHGDDYDITAKFIELSAPLTKEEFDACTEEERNTVNPQSLEEGVLYKVMTLDLVSESIGADKKEPPEMICKFCILDTLDSNDNVCCISSSFTPADRGTKLSDISFFVPDGFAKYRLRVYVDPADRDVEYQDLEIYLWNIYDWSDDTDSYYEDDTSSESKSSKSSKRSIDSYADA